MQTLDQQRAAFVWDRIQGIDKKYRDLAKSLPALVMSNGLMQTLAFLEGKSTKGSKEHKQLISHILEWLGTQEAQVIPREQAGDFAGAMKALAESDSIAYQRTTEEALAVLRWIRYLADTVV